MYDIYDQKRIFYLFFIQTKFREKTIIIMEFDCSKRIKCHDSLRLVSFDVLSINSFYRDGVFFESLPKKQKIQDLQDYWHNRFGQ